MNDDYALCVVGRSASFSQSSRSALCDRVVVAMSIGFLSCNNRNVMFVILSVLSSLAVYERVYNSASLVMDRPRRATRKI